MNERQWWSSHVKPRWHKPELGCVAWKVEDAFNGGLPDVDVCFHGVVAKIELKYEAAWPARPDTKLWFSTVGKTPKIKSIVSEGQFNHLRQWQQAGGTALVFIGIGKDWLILESGKFENVPMTKAQLYAVAVHHQNWVVAPTYASISEVPSFIQGIYGHE